MCVCVRERERESEDHVIPRVILSRVTSSTTLCIY